jgi:hypothetical protein
MAIIKGLEIWYPRLDPKRPNKAFNKERPTWEIQVRTTDVNVKKEADAAGLKLKVLVHKEGEENEGEPILRDGKKQYIAHLRKYSIKSDGTVNAPVEVFIMQKGERVPADPRAIGNGSIVNIRIFQYEYEAGGKTKQASVLMGVQIKKLIKYESKGGDYEDFDDEDDTEIEDAPESGDDDAEEDTPKTKKGPSVSQADDEPAF